MKELPALVPERLPLCADSDWIRSTACEDRDIACQSVQLFLPSYDASRIPRNTLTTHTPAA